MIWISFILLLFSCIALVVGLIHPTSVIKWGNKRTRGRVSAIYIPAIFVSFIFCLITVPMNNTSPQHTLVENNKPFQNAITQEHIDPAAKTLPTANIKATPTTEAGPDVINPKTASTKTEKTSPSTNKHWWQIWKTAPKDTKSPDKASSTLGAIDSPSNSPESSANKTNTATDITEKPPSVKLSKADKEKNLINNLSQLNQFVIDFKKANSNGHDPFWNCDNPKSAGTPRIGFASEIDLNACGKINWKSWSTDHQATLITDPSKLPDNYYYGTFTSGVFATNVPPDSVYGNDDKVGANEGPTGSGDWTKGDTKIYFLQNNALKNSNFYDITYSTTATDTPLGLTFKNFHVDQSKFLGTINLKISFDVQNRGQDIQTITNTEFVLKPFSGSTIWANDGTISNSSGSYYSLELLKDDTVHVVISFNTKDKSIQGDTLSIPRDDGTLIQLLTLY